jgi:hypothetical protein
MKIWIYSGTGRLHLSPLGHVAQPLCNAAAPGRRHWHRMSVGYTSSIGLNRHNRYCAAHPLLIAINISKYKRADTTLISGSNYIYLALRVV